LRRQSDAAEPLDPMEDESEELTDDVDDDESERKVKKKPKAPAKSKAKTPKAVKPAARMRIVWTVMNDAFKPIATFEYAQKEAAEAKAAEMSARGKGTHFVMKTKEPMPENAPGFGAAIPRSEAAPAASVVKQAAAVDDDEDEVQEKKTKKKARPAAKSKAKTAKPAKPAARMRIVWTVMNDAFKPIATFEYSQKEAADAKAAEMTARGKGTHFVMKSKEPMPDNAPGLGAAIPRSEVVPAVIVAKEPAAVEDDDEADDEDEVDAEPDDEPDADEE